MVKWWLVLVAACGRIDFDPLAATTGASPVCVNGWCWEAPLPTGEPLYMVSERAPDDVWAVGGIGLVMHYDGTTWTRQYVGTTDLHGVAAIAADDVWIAGYRGVVAHFDGSGWTEGALPVSPTYGVPDTNAMWATARNDVWVGAFGGVVSHYDGASWTTTDVAAPFGDFWEVWGSARDDVWFFGDNEAVHWDGTQFVTGAPTGVQGVGWGYSRTDVWGADVNGGLRHDANGTWTPVAASTQFSYSGGWCPGPDEAWIVTYDGKIVHATPTITATPLDAPDFSVLWSVAGVAGDAWAVGAGGRQWHFDGTTWTPLYPPLTGTLTSISGTADDDVWAAGDGGTVMHHDAVGWTASTVGDATANWRAVYAVARDDVFLAGPQLLHYDRTAWTDIGEAGIAYFQVWASGADDVWALTQTLGDLRHFDGGAWTISSVQGNPIAILGFARDDVWLCTETMGPVKGYVYHLEGGSWVLKFSPPNSEVVSVFAGTSSSDLWFAVGNPTDMFHWDGATATNLPRTWPINSNPQAAWARSANEVYFVDEFENLFEWNGSEIVQLPSPTADQLAGVWGTADRVWLVGQDGAILTRAP
jgi:hypothetical protein